MPQSTERRRLATVTIPAPDLRPETFLRHSSGDARGFWARGDRWVAHRGVAAELKGGSSEGGAVVHCHGTLSGTFADGAEFQGIRFIDRFTVRDGKLVDQRVWNDMAEVRFGGG